MVSYESLKVETCVLGILLTFHKDTKSDNNIISGKVQKLASLFIEKALVTSI